MINPLISSESHTNISPMACEQVNMKKETDKKNIVTLESAFEATITAVMHL